MQKKTRTFPFPHVSLLEVTLTSLALKSDIFFSLLQSFFLLFISHDKTAAEMERSDGREKGRGRVENFFGVPLRLLLPASIYHFLLFLVRSSSSLIDGHRWKEETSQPAICRLCESVALWLKWTFITSEIELFLSHPSSAMRHTIRFTLDQRERNIYVSFLLPYLVGRPSAVKSGVINSGMLHILLPRFILLHTSYTGEEEKMSLLSLLPYKGFGWRFSSWMQNTFFVEQKRFIPPLPLLL